MSDLLEQKEIENTWRQGVRDALAEMRRELQKSEDALDASLDLKDYQATAKWQARGEVLKSCISKVEQLAIFLYDVGAQNG